MTTVDEERQQLAEEAMTADTRPPAPFRLFGKIVTVDMWNCVLETGRGKIPYDPAKHAPFRKRLSLTIVIQAIDSAKTYKKEFLIGDNRDDKGWSKIALPSLRLLNLHLTTLESTHVAVDFAPTGRKYQDKDSNERDETTFKFIESYPSSEACEAGSRMFYAGYDEDQEAASTTTDDPDFPIPPAEIPPPAPVAPNVTLQAAKALWGASGKNPDKFTKMINGNPQVLAGFASVAAALAAVQES